MFTNAAKFEIASQIVGFNRKFGRLLPSRLQLGITDFGITIMKLLLTAGNARKLVNTLSRLAEVKSRPTDEV